MRPTRPVCSALLPRRPSLLAVRVHFAPAGILGPHPRPRTMSRATRRRPRMTSSPSKSALKQELVRILQADLETLERAQQAAREGATHEEAKPENDKDTRALEQSYLARGQAMRLEELRTGLAQVQAMPVRDFDEGAKAALGALVTIEDDESTRVVFIAPYGGGSRLSEGAVQVTTPRSPLGQALLGRTEGDDCELRLEGRLRILTIGKVE